MKQNVILATLLLSIFNCNAKQSVYIIIHGTWCTPFNWHMPGGDFYQALQASAQHYDATVTFLQWNGQNSHTARVLGAQLLCNLIATYNPNDEINIVAHSHGGNVGILASHMLEETEYRITHFFALGTPIHDKTYLPNMHRIENFYNLFSFGDMVQTVGGLYKQELPALPNCHNIRVELSNKQPNHCAMHHTLIGAWIPMREFWDELSDQKEYLVLFETGTCPTLRQDTSRPAHREKIQALLALYNDPLRKT